MSKFENNLTEGPVLSKLVRFSVPFLISNIVQSLYNVADMLIVGNFCGPAAMSGVNIGGQVTFILTNLVIGLCSGGTILIAQYLGAGKKEDMEKTTATVFTVLVAAAAILTALMLFLKTPILRLIRTPEESFAEASSYLTVTVCGLIFIFAYNALSGIMRGMGDSKRPFVFVLVSCIANIGLDLLFVAGLSMGAFGAALATVISQAISMALCVAYMIRNKFVFDFKPSSFRVDKAKLSLIFQLGLPSAIQNTVSSISFTFITAMVNGYGVYASAAVGAIGKFNGFAIMPAVAMSASISTMAAQNIGADKWDRAIKSCRIGVLVSAVIGVAVFVVVQLFPVQILSIFGTEPEMIAAGTAYIRTFSLDYLVVPFVFCINGLFTGAGHTMFSLINSMLSSLVLRIPVSYIFGNVLGWGLSGIGMGAPAATFGSLLVIIGFLISGRWRVNVVKQRGEALPAK
ncbi:MATE family efflux transporter [Ruminococcaceae bacterium OttesenSCG-928-L11]|nr:MATE family efflux transporter [Ruminococcaceae bacterium OttesenSCG-928-L11]